MGENQDRHKQWHKRVSKQENMDFWELWSYHGFLVYMGRAYPFMVPYLKGFHLTIESWRDGWDSEGWKLPKARSEEDEEDLRDLEEDEDDLLIHN